MAVPQIVINQTGQSAGVAGVSRDDLLVGFEVTCTDDANGIGTYQWFLVVPPDSATVGTGLNTDTLTFTPDTAGTYLVYLLFNGIDASYTEDEIGQKITDQGGAGVKLTNGIRIPGVGETLQFGENGWATALTTKIKNDVIIKDDGSALVNGPHNQINFKGLGSVTTLISNAGSGQANITISGSPSTFVQEDTVSIPSTPHSILNFTGDGVSVANSGGGVATVTIPGGLTFVQDEGSPVSGSPHDTLNFIGDSVTLSDEGSGVVRVTISGADLILKEEGTSISSGSFNSIDFVGPGITVENLGGRQARVSASGIIAVQDEGEVVEGGPFSILNFIGAAITASGTEGGVVDINVTATGGGGGGSGISVGKEDEDFIDTIRCGSYTSYNSETPKIVSQFQFNPLDYELTGTTVAVQFKATASNGDSNLLSRVILYNLTDQEEVANFGFTSTNPTTSGLMLPIAVTSGIKEADTIYETRIYVLSPVTEDDTIEFGSAELNVFNNIDVRPIGLPGEQIIDTVRCGEAVSYFSSTPKIVSQFQFDPSIYELENSSVNIEFRVVASIGNPGITGRVILQNITDNEEVSNIGFTSSNPTLSGIILPIAVTSGIQNVSTIYETRIYVDSPTTEDDTIELGSAELRVSNIID